ncbi:MAG TPA: hypothetical protein VIV60_15900, partial [Polyangiaceae bacterium]
PRYRLSRLVHRKLGLARTQAYERFATPFQAPLRQSNRARKIPYHRTSPRELKPRIRTRDRIPWFEQEDVIQFLLSATTVHEIDDQASLVAHPRLLGVGIDVTAATRAQRRESVR